jgi:ATP-dependent Clp protease ATP-binding subunit ClpB
LTPQARTWLADKGYDPAYGARPLKRVIQKSVQDPLAEKILAGGIHDGETVPIDVDGDGLGFGKRPEPPAPTRKPTIVHFPKGA